MRNTVFIATSIDGYIADSQGEIDWLTMVPNPEGLDMGFAAIMDRVDAVVMGRNTFKVVEGFEGDWPYSKPVFVVSESMAALDEKYQGKVELLKGSIASIEKQLFDRGCQHLYIDGGGVIQSFLAEDKIDELIITTIPILLGGGVPLFGVLKTPLTFDLVESRVYLDAMVQTRYKRIRD